MAEPTKIDFHTKIEIESAINRIEEILKCGIFDPKNQRHVLFRAAFIEMLIALRDLMFKSNKFGRRISFTDDIKQNKDVQDVTSLIKYVRDAICHPDSDNHYIDKSSGIKATFNVAFGKVCLMRINDFELTADYDDDICFFFGAQGIYLNRHVVRAFNEAKGFLLPLINESSHVEVMS